MTTFYIQQFGCRATQADGAALERQLLDRGCTQAPDPATASIVVLNTCTVTAAADAQARDAIRKLHAQNPQARLIVTGCYAQRAPEELASLPGVTHVVGNPPCQLVKFGHRCEQVPAHAVAIPAFTKQWEHVRGQIVGDG